MKADNKLQGVHISVCAVAAPAVVSRDLAEGCCDFVTSIVCRVCLPPCRLSQASLIDQPRMLDCC